MRKNYKKECQLIPMLVANKDAKEDQVYKITSQFTMHYKILFYSLVDLVC